jgi:hypothetical protein
MSASANLELRMKASGLDLAAAELRKTAGEIEKVGKATRQSNTHVSTLSRALGRLKAPSTLAIHTKVTGDKQTTSLLGKLAGAGAGAVALGTAVVYIAYKTIKGAIETAETTGRAVTQLESAGVKPGQALVMSEVSQAAGIAPAKMNMSIKALALQTTAVERGGKAAKTATRIFADLGISTDEVRKHSNNLGDMMTLVAGRLDHVKNASLRTADASKLLGRGYMAMNPLLAHGGEGMRELTKYATQLNSSLGIHGVVNIERYHLASMKMHLTWQAIQLFIAEKVIPILIKFADWIQAKVIPAIRIFSAWVKENLLPILKSAGDFIGGKLIPAISDLATFIRTKVIPVVRDIVGWVKVHLVPAFKDASKWVIQAVKDIAQWIQTKLIPAFKAIVHYIEVNIMPTVLKLWNHVFKPMIGLIVGAVIFLGGKLLWLWNNVVKPVALWVGGAILFLVTKVFVPLFKVAAGALVFIADKFKWLWGNVIKPIAGWIGGAMGTITGAIVGAWHKFTGFIGFITGLPSKIASIAKGLWTGLKGDLADVINWIIDKFNGIPMIHGGHIGPIHIPGIPTIPHVSLAAGGIVTRPTRALIGESGPEAVIPLSQVSGGGGHVLDNHVTINVDGRQLARAMTRSVTLAKAAR